MPTVEAAAVAATTYVALFAGHQLGDHPFQSTAAAAGKSAPDHTELAQGAHPWQGWSWCIRHVAVYTAAQTACLALVSIVAPLHLIGVLAALAVSSSTHAVIDRRWLVRWFLAAKGARDWPEGPYLVDQSLHLGALLLAAVAAAAVTGLPGFTATLLASLGVVAAGLAVERHRARAALPAPIGVARH